MKTPKLDNLLCADLLDPDPEHMAEKVTLISPVLIAILLKAKIQKADIEAYLLYEGQTSDTIEQLFEAAKFYNRINLKDNEYITYTLLWKAIQDNNYSASIKLLDMLNKMQGKYEQKLKLDSNEPIKISFN